MITLWHNPRCSKSRATLALIEEAGITPDLRRYLDDAPSAEEISAMIAALGIATYLDMMRTGEARFKDLGLTKDSPEDALLQAMVDNPILIERPIAYKDGQAVIGRPPENVKDLF